MSVAGKVAWYVETNLDHPKTLQGMAEALGVSRFHLAHSFALLSGQPVMRYVWRRRLSRAVAALVQTDHSVIRIALDAGYASPEAFTRAFRAEFGLSPRMLRQNGTLQGLTLTQPLEDQRMTATLFSGPKLEAMPATAFAGPVRHYDMQTRSAIPAQWDAYNHADLRAASPKPHDYFGIVFNFSEDKAAFDYMCGQHLTSGAAMPEGFKKLNVPAGNWARFATKAHISTMPQAWGEVMGHWLGQPGCIPREGPSIEYYPPEFDGMTGKGGYEIWVPVA